MADDSSEDALVLVLKVRRRTDPPVGEVGVAGDLRPFRGWADLAAGITQALGEDEP
ncbi:MAG: hypothetical protein ACTHJM_10070 [Marmoricola sp.]